MNLVDEKTGNKEIRIIKLERRILEKNDVAAEAVRDIFRQRNILALNLISSPGSGKTSLLEYMLKKYGNRRRFAVIEGDQQTKRDAERIRSAGVPVVQINTVSGCHLNAHQVRESLAELPLDELDCVFIENVGNLVCPASFDLGEDHKVILLSVTEGEDKPVKYPLAFRLAGALVITKTDLLPHLKFDVSACIDYARKINSDVQIFQTSTYSGAGVDDWFHWLDAGIARKKSGN